VGKLIASFSAFEQSKTSCRKYAFNQDRDWWEIVVVLLRWVRSHQCWVDRLLSA